LQQWTPERDLLYLDKAWPMLQDLTRGESPGPADPPAYRMFEGWVTQALDGYGWLPWVRALGPDEMPAVAEDLGRLTPAAAGSRLRGRGLTSGDIDYVLQYLERARTFVDGLVDDHRGMAYLIG